MRHGEADMLTFENPYVVLSWTSNVALKDKNNIRSLLRMDMVDSDDEGLTKGLGLGDKFFFKEDYGKLIKRYSIPVKFDVDYLFELESQQRSRKVIFTPVVSLFLESPVIPSRVYPLIFHLIGHFEAGSVTTVDDLIALVHMLWGAETSSITLHWQNAEQQAFHGTTLEEVLRSEIFSKEIKFIQKTFLLHLPTDRNPNNFLRRGAHIKELYGLLFSDEGWKDVPYDYAMNKLAKLYWSSKEFFIIMYSPVSILLLERLVDRRRLARARIPRKVHQDFLQLHSSRYPAVVGHGAFQSYEWICFTEALVSSLESEHARLERAARELTKKERIIKKLQNIVIDYRKLQARINEIRKYLEPAVLHIPELQTASKEIYKLKGIEEAVTRAEKHQNLARERLSQITQELWLRSEASRDWIINLLVIVLSVLSSIEVIDILLGSLGYTPPLRTYYDIVAGAIVLILIAFVLSYYKDREESKLRERLASYF